MENKTGKYFKYAIGEIVLVVIGILIALSINNWNENRKNIQIKRTYYVQLLNDFENDKMYLKEVISNADSSFIIYQSYKETFEKPNISLWQACRNMGKVFYSGIGENYNFEMNSTTINVLQNTGDIKLIPEGIRNKILEFKVKQSSLIDYVKNSAQNISNSMLATNKLYGGENLTNRIWNQPKLIKYFSDEKIELQAFLELESLLSKYMELKDNERVRMKELIMDIEKLTLEINKELEK